MKTLTVPLEAGDLELLKLTCARELRDIHSQILHMIRERATKLGIKFPQLDFIIDYPKATVEDYKCPKS